MTTSGPRRVSALAHARAVRGAADLPGVADVAQADVVGGVEAGLGAQVAVRERPEAASTSRPRRRGLGVPSQARRGRRTPRLPVRSSTGEYPATAGRVARACAQIRLHDTLDGRAPAARAARPGKVGIYACGPTVYGRIHVGNARPFVVFSLLKRFLEHEGYDVDARGQHHRHQRQDLRRRAREPGVPQRAAGARR